MYYITFFFLAFAYSFLYPVQLLATFINTRPNLQPKIHNTVTLPISHIQTTLIRSSATYFFCSHLQEKKNKKINKNPSIVFQIFHTHIYTADRFYDHHTTSSDVICHHLQGTWYTSSFMLL